MNPKKRYMYLISYVYDTTTGSQRIGTYTYPSIKKIKSVADFDVIEKYALADVKNAKVFMFEYLGKKIFK